MGTCGRACVLSAAMLLGGCGAFDEGEAWLNSVEVAQDIETSLGTKPYVFFETSGHSLTQVSIIFDDVPKGASIEQTAALSRRAIATRFKRSPDTVFIGFTLPGEAR